MTFQMTLGITFKQENRKTGKHLNMGFQRSIKGNSRGLQDGALGVLEGDSKGDFTGGLETGLRRGLVVKLSSRAVQVWSRSRSGPAQVQFTTQI